ncbi:MAG: flavodoxin family protein [Dehalococcoidales bacterium]|nr:flavodoxin family protein [Dehalococcoidales bacterium]
MKILGLSCSPRKSGNTEILVSEALEGARKEGAEAELYSFSGKEIKPCDGCQSCIKTGKCHIKDDMQTVYQKMIEADGIIFGTPVYFYSMAAQAKALIDRTYCLRRPDFKLVNKVGGVITVAGSLGRIDVLKDLYFNIAINHMIPADYVAASASEKGAVKKDEKAMKMAWELGREMAQLTMTRFEFPREFIGRLSTYVADKYQL